MHLDHVELFVPDREQAAEWYGQVFGLKPLEAWAKWATPRGPLMISADGGQSMIALFVGDPCSRRSDRGHHRVAFRVSGPVFQQFVRSPPPAPLYDADGGRLTSLTPVDHDGACSVYFSDPWGYRCELTTYDTTTSGVDTRGRADS